jgi:hypothetical protein
MLHSFHFPVVFTFVSASSPLYSASYFLLICFLFPFRSLSPLFCSVFFLFVLLPLPFYFTSPSLCPARAFPSVLFPPSFWLTSFFSSIIVSLFVSPFFPCHPYLYTLSSPMHFSAYSLSCSIPPFSSMIIYL